MKFKWHNQEHEIKILDIDKQEIKKKIYWLWWQWSDSFLVTDYYRDTIDDEFADKKQKLKLRVVSNEDECEVMIKTKLSSPDTKNSDEKSRELSSYKFAKKLLRSANLKCKRIKQKVRTVAKIWSIEFMIDEYPWLPALLEIEWPNYKLIKSRIWVLDLNDNTKLKRWRKGLMKVYGKQVTKS